MTPAQELQRLERKLMVFPRSIHLQRQIQELRRQIALQKAVRARALRGRIRRLLMEVDDDTLARVARELEAS